MELQTFKYLGENKWSVNEFPKLDSKDSLVIVFGAPELANEQQPFSELKQKYPNTQIVGCSTSGEIFQNEVNDATLSVATLLFEKSRVRTEMAELDNPIDSNIVGKKLANKLMSDDLVSILVLSNGLTVNGSELVRGLRSELSEDVIITGGLAGDGDRFQSTWVLYGDSIKNNGVVVIGFYGNSLQVGYGSKGGWDIFGPERTITRSEGNIVYEIDDQPALALYKNYLGEEADGLPGTGLLFPLSIRSDSDEEQQLVRTLLAVDEEKQSLTFAGDVYQGWRAQLMRANFDRLVEGAEMAGEEAKQKINGNGGDTLSIAISCVGRRLVLRERTEEEVESTLDALPKNTKQIGFYSYGEISPSGVGNCDLHNQTMTITTIKEG